VKNFKFFEDFLKISSQFVQIKHLGADLYGYPKNDVSEVPTM
jgi:hypothetical protein